MNGPDRLVQHLVKSGYNPRSDTHSNAICLAILDDIIKHCPAFARRAKSGEIVAKLNHRVTVGHARWKIDLAVGLAPDLPIAPESGRIRMAAPAIVEVALEAKSIMTEHGKARRNRQRDLQAFYGHAHDYNPKTVSVGTVVINTADVFWSPLRGPDSLTQHSNIARLGGDTINLFRDLPLRHAATDRGFDAVSVVVVSLDNLQKNPNLPQHAPKPTTPRLVSTKPAPSVGDPLHYSTMVHRICTAYAERWA